MTNPTPTPLASTAMAAARELPPLGTGPATLDYISALKVGERVIETTHSAMYGITGTVYLSKGDGSACVMWDMPDRTRMGTSITWGTRRIKDVFAACDSLFDLRADLAAKEAARKDTMPGVVLRMEYNWITIRTDTGWLLWSTKSEKIDASRGIDLGGILDEVSKQYRAWFNDPAQIEQREADELSALASRADKGGAR